MRKSGTVIKWHADRGFGFIRDGATGSDVFFHIRDFQGQGLPANGLTVSFDDIQVGGKGTRAMAVRPAGSQPSGLAPAARADAPESWRLQQQPGRPDATRGQGRPASRQGPAHTARAHASGTRLRSTARRGATRRDADQRPGAQSSWAAVLLTAGWLGLLGWGIQAARLPLAAAGVAALLSLATFMAYWMDKHAAQTGRWRTPEKTLHLLALAGGWPGAWMAQQLLRHKSKKAAFRAMYWLTVALNCGALAAWIFWPPLQTL